MSTAKIINALILAVVVGLVAWGLTFIHVGTQGGTAATAQPSEFTESGQYYDITVKYPAVPEDKKQVIEQSFAGDIADFKSAVTDLTPAMMPSLADHKLALDAEFTQATSTNFDSYLYTIYEDTGGAHPNGYFKTFVFDNGGSLVSLKAIFKVASSTYLARIATLAEAQVKAQMTERLGSDWQGALFEDGFVPTEDNYSNWVIDGTTLHIYFPPYQVAAYAAGSFDIAIPLSQLSDILKPGVM